MVDQKLVQEKGPLTGNRSRIALATDPDRILFGPDGGRRLPSVREMEALLQNGVVLSDLLRGSSQFYFIPTREWVRGVACLCRLLHANRILEIGAGDGFVAACLAELGCEVVAVDIQPAAETYYPVHAEDHASALAHFQPDFALWCWPPMQCREIEQVIEFATLRFFLETSDGGHTAGRWETIRQYRGRYLRTLSTWGFGWIDYRNFRHHRSFLFHGSGHSHTGSVPAG